MAKKEKEKPVQRVQICKTCTHAIEDSNGVITCMFGWWQTYAENHCEQWSDITTQGAISHAEKKVF